MGDQGGVARDALAAGSLVAGRYRIESLLGRGASSLVYRVFDARDGARVALKQLRVGDTSRAALLTSQFEREYHTLFQLAHPRIIEVYDYGVDGGVAFYTMELLDGQDLRERGQLPWREACALLRDVASSLAILHSRRLLHRDLSARNVRRTSDGRAKLIDFGAMAPMGGVKNVVGTPPFVPPEALQLQALDARADLYALGALAYFVLSGRHAYAARTFEQLADAWRSAPVALQQLVPGLPPQLAQMVMQLLQLDREARPGSAADVMERLSGVAGLAQERSEVTRAYLVTPTLVGRDALVQEVRATLGGAGASRGACMLIEGAAGSGRSRLLDACVLEAKLLGATVLRADAADAVTGDYGVVRALCVQLREALPDLAERSALPRAELLAHVLASEPGAERATARPPERRHVQAALRDFLLATARGRRLVIAVDDVEAIDEPSSALLAMLAHGAQHRSLSLVLTADASAASTPALSVLREDARVLRLEPLTANETEALLRAVFGDVYNIAALAERVHELSSGSPRGVMALAERLVERGIARYEAGSWALPAILAPGDLPESLSATLAARIAGLPDDARALGEALALTDPSALSLPDYPSLTEHGDHGRTFAALAALVSAAVLAPAGDRYRFAQRDLSALLAHGVGEPRRRALHARIARALPQGEALALLPHHLLLGGMEAEAIDRLLPLRADPRVGYSVFTLELLDRAIPAAERLRLPMQVRVELLMWMIDNASMLGEYERFLRHALPLLEQLEQDSGLRAYQELPDTLPPQVRLEQALARAQQRHDATPESERGLPPAAAIPRLARLCAMFNSMVSVVQDLEFHERVPSLEPLCALSPALWVVHRLVQSARDFQSGRYDDSGEKALEVLERLSQPDRAMLDAAYHKTVRLGVLYRQGSLAAGRGQAAVPAWIAELENEPGHRVNAWRLRMSYELMQGNLDAARLCQRRAELLHLQDGGQLIFPGTTHRIELIACTYAEDVLGVKRVMERIESSAARYPRWQITLGVARAVYRWLQGDLEGALAAIEPALAASGPGRHLDWGFASVIQINVLIAMRRYDEAVTRALACLAICRRERLSPTHRSLMRLAAEALLGAGRLEQASAMAEACARETDAAGARGLLLRSMYETRARVAIALGDEPAFRRALDRYVEDSRLGHAPTFGARHAQLLEDARARGFVLGRGGQRESERVEPDPSGRPLAAPLLSDLATDARRSGCLKLLLEATSATRGYLFGLRNGQLELLASSDAQPPRGLCDMLASYFQRQLEIEAAATEIDAGSLPLTENERWTDPSGRVFEPMLITGRRAGELFVTAVAAIHHEGEQRVPARRALLEAIGDALLDGDDVDPVTCVA